MTTILVSDASEQIALVAHYMRNGFRLDWITGRLSKGPILVRIVVEGES